MTPYYDQDRITIFNADSTTALRNLPSSSIDAVITDPPYSSGGMVRGDRTQSVRTKYQQTQVAVWSKLAEFGGDTRDQRSYGFWSTLWLAECLRIAKPGAVCCVFTDWRQIGITTDAFQAGGWVWRGIAVWDKTPAARPALGRFASQCEYIVWGSKGPLQDTRRVPCLPGVVRQPPLYEGRDNKQHIAQKPIEVMRYVVELCVPGGTILDPFIGSGTTLRAAKDTGRNAIGIEVNPSFAEIAVKRLAQSVLPLEVA